MRYRKLSASGDYTFGNGQNNFYRDIPQAPGQAVQTRLQLWLGEWYLNIDEGTPYLLSILGKHSKDQANVTLQERILETQGVTNLNNFVSEINQTTRMMTATADVDTIYGPTTVQIANYANY